MQTPDRKRRKRETAGAKRRRKESRATERGMIELVGGNSKFGAEIRRPTEGGGNARAISEGMIRLKV